MKMKGKNILKMEIRKLMPDDWTNTVKYQFLTELADEYRKKSQDEVNADERKFRSRMPKKDIDYTPTLRKDAAKG